MIAREAYEALGKGEALEGIEELLSQCEAVTERRNEIVHSVWAKWYEGSEQLFDGDRVLPIPTIAELETLEREIHQLAEAINGARLWGFIAHALRSTQARAE